MSETNEELLNCPFCESGDLEIDSINVFQYKTNLFWVNCLNIQCNATGPTGDSEAEAIKKWNTRYTTKFHDVEEFYIDEYDLEDEEEETE